MAVLPVPVRYRGALLEVRVDAEKVHLQVMEGGAAVTVRVYGVDYEIDAWGVVRGPDGSRAS